MATLYSQITGNWSNATTMWNTAANGSGTYQAMTNADVATVQTDVTVDTTTCVADSVQINAGGTLRPSTSANSKLTVDKGITVANSATATLSYDMSSAPNYIAELVWNLDNDTGDNQTNAISISGQATLKGADKKYYTFAEGALTKDSSVQCYVDDATGWIVGDKLCFADTQAAASSQPSITNVTYNTPGAYLEITAASHGLEVGDMVQFFNLQSGLNSVTYTVSVVVSSSVFRVPSSSVTVTDTAGFLQRQARAEIATIATITFDNAPTNTGRALVTWTDGLGTSGALCHNHDDNCVVGNLTRNVIFSPGVSMGKLLLTPGNSTYTKPLSNVLFRNFNGSLAGFPDATMVFTSGKFSEITNCVFYNWTGSVQGSSNAGGGDFTRTRNTYYNEFNGGLYAYSNLSGNISTEDDMLVLRGSLNGMVTVSWVLGTLINPLISGVTGIATTPGNAAFSTVVPPAAGRASVEGGAIWSCLNVITQGQGTSGIAPISLSNTRLGIGPTGANYTAQNAFLASASGTALVLLDTCPLYSTSEVARAIGTGGEFQFLNKDEDPGVQEVYNNTSYTVPIISRVTDTISNSTSAIMMQWTGTGGAQYVRDLNVVIGANATETILIKVRKNTSYGSSTLPKAVVYDGTNVVSTETMSNTADTWETLTVEITNSNSSDKQYRIRLAGQSAVTGAKCWFAGVPLAPFVTKVRWYGYEFIEASATRRTDVYVVASEATALAYTGVTLNNTTKAITFSAGTADTMQKFYDYSRAWCVADVSRDIPFVRAGSLFQLDTDWKVTDPYYTDTLTWGGGTVEFTSTGTKTVSLSDTTVQMSATGDYDLSGSALTGPIAFTTDTGVRVVTVTVPAGFTDYTTEGANITVSTPALERGLEFTGLVAGSFVKVFTTTTTTEQFSTLSSGTSETWDDATSGSLTVDYVIMKAGYLPIRVTGVTVTGAVGTGVQTVPITQTIDRSYTASSGLTWAEIALDTTSKYVKLNDTSTVQNLYSFMIEQWIDRGGVGATGAELANVKFPMTSNGPGGFSLIDGWETRGFTTAGTGIANTTLTNLYRDGLRYVDTGGTQTSVWAAILTSGVPTGKQVRYQQSDAGTTVDALNTGNMDELVHVYGDASHGNFDKRGYLVLKVQAMEYDQAEANVVSLYGNLEDQLYVVGLAPTPNGVATGNPSLATAPTISQGTYVEDGKTFSVKIVDGSTANTGTGIMRWLRYNFETGGAFQSEDAFNWHDLVQTNGSAFKTVRGTVYGTATTKGVVVYQKDETTLHPDFTLFTADNGTTYSPPATLTVSLSGFVSGTRIQIYDTLNSAELFNGVVSATTKLYTETYTVDRTIRVRASYVNGTSAKMFTEQNLGTLTSTATSVSRDLGQEDDEVYNANAVDGSLVNTPDVIISITDATFLVSVDTGSISLPTIYAYQCYWLYDEEGIRDEGSFITATDTANYRFADFNIKNVSSPTAPLIITGGYATDFTTGDAIDIIDTTGGTIFLTPNHVIPYAAGAEATVAIVQSGLTAQGYSTTRAGKIDNLDMSIVASTQA